MYFSDWLILHVVHLKIMGRSLQYTPQSHLEGAELLRIVVLSVKGQNVCVVNSQQLKYSTVNGHSLENQCSLQSNRSKQLVKFLTAVTRESTGVTSL